MISLLNESIRFSNEKVIEFKFSTRNKYQSYSIGIYCSILELSQSFHMLIDSKNSTGSLSVYRTFLENYVDLKNLKIDISYIEQLDHMNLISMKKDLESAEKGNEYLKPLAKHVNSKLPELLSDIEKLKSTMKQKPLNIKGKFEKAKMLSEYTGLYPKLCSDAHCSVSAILDRHFNYDISKDSVEVVVNSDKPTDDFDFYLCNMAHQLLDAGAILCDILDDNRVDSYLKERERVRKSVESTNT